MKLESLKSSKFEAMSNEKMSAIKGGGWTATSWGETRKGSFVSDREYRNSAGKLICNDVTYKNGTTERLCIAVECRF